MNQDGMRKVLKAEKTRLGLTWKKISRDSGVSYTALCNFVYGCRNTSMDVIIRLFDTMGLELCVRRKKDEAKNLRQVPGKD